MKRIALSAVNFLQPLPTWVVLLCIALAFAPSANLHIHEVDHPSAPAGILASLDNIEGGHAHAIGVHSAIDHSHGDHHDGTATDLDTSPKICLKKVGTAMTFALLVFVFLALLAPAGLSSFAAQFLGARAPPERYHLIQPVRAPPAS